MSNLQHRQSIIQEKRKKTPWRDFVMEFASRFPLVLQKDKNNISRYPSNGRRQNMLYDQNFDVGFGVVYNNMKSFIPQLNNLFVTAPKLGNLNFPNLENCQFSEGVYGGKNCYLSIDVGEGVENILYSSIILIHCKNVISSINVNNNSENIYFSKNITSGFNIFYSKYLHSSNNIWFSTNLIGCSECLFCNDLQNQQYCIKNKKFEKDEYYKKKELILQNKMEFELFYERLVESPFIRNCNNSKGGGLTHCNDIQNGYFLTRFAHGANVMLGEGGDQSTNCYDCFYVGTNAHDYYGMVSSGIESSNCYCSVRITHSYSIFYSYYLDNCSFCLGCIGLKNKSYCILNKQYTKEERYEKVDEIFGQMHADGVLGDFFPASMNPFYFNDTAAYLIDPSFTKEEVTAKGFLRRDEPIKVDIPAGVQTVSVKDLDKYEGWKPKSVSNVAQDAVKIEQDVRRFGKMSEDTTMGKIIGHHNSSSDILPENQHIQQLQWYIDDEILKKVIIDEQGNAYRIIPMELEFLRKYELPLPRKHWLDRMKENFRIN